MSNDLLSIKIDKIIKQIKSTNKGISFEQAVDLANTDCNQLPWLMAAANEIRIHFLKNKVKLCTITNAKNGLCDQDCAFCAQSKIAEAKIEKYKLKPPEVMKKEAEYAAEIGAVEFSIVTSGKNVSQKEIENIKKTLELTKDLPLKMCGSLGNLSFDNFSELKKSGLSIIHHNLETCKKFYPKIVSTRNYDSNVNTVKNAKKAGLKVCCGGLFGLGENWEHRIELFMELRELNVNSVPINYLIPIKGTPLGQIKKLSADEALKIITICRLILPDKDVIVAGGREVILSQFQSMIFYAGASGFLIGNYLTTKGRSPKDDIELVKMLGLEAVTE